MQPAGQWQHARGGTKPVPGRGSERQRRGHSCHAVADELQAVPPASPRHSPAPQRSYTRLSRRRGCRPPSGSDRQNSLGVYGYSHGRRCATACQWQHPDRLRQAKAHHRGHTRQTHRLGVRLQRCTGAESHLDLQPAAAQERQPHRRQFPPRAGGQGRSRL